MPCSACGSSRQNKKNFQLNKHKQKTNQKIIYLTAQQVAAIRARRYSYRRTLVIT
jgi:hypothetical protein